jgi:hypothetical protein
MLKIIGIVALVYALVHFGIAHLIAIWLLVLIG